MSKLLEYDSDSSLSDFDMESTTIELNRKEGKTDGIFLQFQEQCKDALTSLMIAAKILTNSKCKKSEMRNSIQNQ